MSIRSRRRRAWPQALLRLGCLCVPWAGGSDDDDRMEPPSLSINRFDARRLMRRQRGLKRLHKVEDAAGVEAACFCAPTIDSGAPTFVACFMVHLNAGSTLTVPLTVACTSP
uniref:Secreted protein n=1 Tax=Panagrellus redivivus TaxID=6233 RepID=A0A7E4ZQR8_PANRE